MKLPVFVAVMNQFVLPFVPVSVSEPVLPTKDSMLLYPFAKPPLIWLADEFNRFTFTGPAISE